MLTPVDNRIGFETKVLRPACEVEGDHVRVSGRVVDGLFESVGAWTEEFPSGVVLDCVGVPSVEEDAKYCHPDVHNEPCPVKFII